MERFAVARVDEPAKFNALMAELVRPALPSDSTDRLIDD
jgi:hypothetical protein